MLREGGLVTIIMLKGGLRRRAPGNHQTSLPTVTCVLNAILVPPPVNLSVSSSH